jgi:hypothetical protein
MKILRFAHGFWCATKHPSCWPHARRRPRCALSNAPPQDARANLALCAHQSVSMQIWIGDEAIVLTKCSRVPCEAATHQRSRLDVPDPPVHNHGTCTIDRYSGPGNTLRPCPSWFFSKSVGQVAGACARESKITRPVHRSQPRETRRGRYACARRTLADALYGSFWGYCPRSHHEQPAPSLQLGPLDQSCFRC